MPLARIFTQVPEYSIRLVEELLARGFDVQTTKPGNELPGPADLEISVEQCSPENAARLAADISAKHDMCVFVSSEAVGRVRSVDMVVLKPRATSGSRSVTPAQVIEISSAIVRPRLATVYEMKPRALPGNKEPQVVGQRGADAIASLSQRCRESAVAAGRAGKRAFRTGMLCSQAFLTEVSQETRRLARRLTDTVVSVGRPEGFEEDEEDLSAPTQVTHERRGHDIDPELVPSLFNLFPGHFDEPETQPETAIPDGMTERLKRIASANFLRNGRFLRVAAPAGLAALLALFLISLSDHDSSPRADVKSNGTVAEHVTESASTHAAGKAQGTHPVAATAPSANAGGTLSTAALKLSDTSKTPTRAHLDADSTVEDTVVRFRNRSASAKQDRLQRYQVKRYSDLD